MQHKTRGFLPLIKQCKITLLQIYPVGLHYHENITQNPVGAFHI